jgi:ketosteroid isomerase-like protein
MDNREPPLAAETAALKAFYAALNQNDIPAMVRVFDPQIERVEFIESPQGGTWHGLEAVTAHFTRARGTWAEGACEPEHFVVAGDRVVVLVHVRVRLKGETQWHQGRIADVFTFRNGKVIQFRSFADRRQALHWAGVEAADTG